MKVSLPQLLKRIIPILALILLLVVCFYAKPSTPHGTPTDIPDDVVPLASLSDAYFWVAHPEVSFNDLSTPTEDKFDFVGEGSVFYTSDIINNPEAVKKAINTAPDISTYVLDGHTIEWRYIAKMDGVIYVGGVYTDIPNAAVDAEYYLFNPELFNATFTNVTPDLAEYIGNGLFYYREDLYNQTDSVWSQVAREPDYEAPSGEYIEWGSAYIYNDKYIVIGRYVEGNKPVLPNLISDNLSDDDIIPETILSFSDIESLKACEAEIGSVVRTDGYRSVGDGGSAEYVVSNSAFSTPDDTFSVRLNNGNYANLIYESDSVINVALFGIFPGEKISDKFNTAIKSVVGKANGLSFNSGTYYIDKPIFLQSMSYYGNDTILEVSDSFYTKDDKVFTCKNKTDEFNIELHNIIFNYPVQDGQQFSGTSTMLMVIYNTNHCIIDSCEFNCSNPDGLDKPVHLLWFKQPNYIKNVYITDSKFINACGEYLTTTRHTDGGCIWFSGSKNQLCQVENININHCTLYSTLNDELMCVWYTDTNGFHVDNCEITNSGQNSDNVCGFLDGKYEDTYVQNTTFNINAPSAWMLKMGNLWGPSHVKYNKCIFNANSQNLQPYKNAYAVFYVYHDNTEHPFSGTSYLTVENCEFYGSNSAGSYRCLFMTYGTENKSITFNNSSLNNFALRESISNIEKCNNCSYSSSNSVSNLNATPYRLTNSTSVNVDVN